MYYSRFIVFIIRVIISMMIDGHQLWYLGVVSNIRLMIPSINRRGAEHNSTAHHHYRNNTNASSSSNVVRLRSSNNVDSRSSMNDDDESTNEDEMSSGVDDNHHHHQHHQQQVRSSEVQLIDRIEAAQLDGKLPTSYRDTEYSNQPCPFVSLHLSKHGLKIVNVNSMVCFNV